MERRSKKGKTFYGCNRWPECNFVAWGKPVAEKCPECGSPYMVEKWLKAGAVWQCPNAECKHKQEAPQPVEALVRQGIPVTRDALTAGLLRSLQENPSRAVSRQTADPSVARGIEESGAPRE